MITAPRAPDGRLTIIAPRRLCTTTAPRGRLTITAPRAPDGCLTSIALRRPRTNTAPRGRFRITAPRAPRVRPTAARWRVRPTIAVVRRPRMVLAREVGVAVASPRAPLMTAVRRAAALASGAATVTTPKKAVTPSAASTGIDKRMLSPCCRVQGMCPHSKALLGMPARRFGPGTLVRIYRELLSETFRLTFFGLVIAYCETNQNVSSPNAHSINSRSPIVFRPACVSRSESKA
jgi:hypothetical protein